MKNVFNMLLCLVLCIALVGCKENSKDQTAAIESAQFESAAVSNEDREAISALWLQLEGETLSWDQQDYLEKPVGFFLGKIGDSSLVLVMPDKDGLTVIPEPSPKMIAGYRFEWHVPFAIYLCGNDAVCDLQQAYAQGQITQEQIGQLHEHFQTITWPQSKKTIKGE